MSSLSASQEAARLDALRALRLLDSAPSESFDRITRTASQLFDLPIAAVSLTDQDRQWFKSRVGVEHTTIPRHLAPCAQVAESCQVLVIEDMLADPGYKDSLLARSGVRFYAGAPLTTAEGHGLGAMCVLGTQPRSASDLERGALKDLASMVMAQIELQHAFGRLDPVSGLPSRVQFVEDLADMARDQSGEKRVALLIDLIAVEQLSHAMRVMGPGFVDDMVREATRNLRTITGPDRTAYHVGIAQFAVLMPTDLDEDSDLDYVETRAKSLSGIAGTNAIGTPALGVAPFRLGTTAPDDVLRIAQGAALDARSSGRLFAYHSSNQDSAFQRSFRLFRDFELALKDPRDLRLVYQPRVDAATGHCIGAEALIRWTHPLLGPIPPSEFIPLIEQSALADGATAWVLDTALRQQAAWRRAGIDIHLSVNVSTANLRDDGFPRKVAAILAAHGAEPQGLELEIIETAALSDTEQALSRLADLAATGIRLAIDDFGTGYSSLSYLQRLPVHVVKIDRTFMQDLDTNPRQLSLVGMMVDMAKQLNLRVVAEGVETQQVLDCLRDTACDEVQGYFYARPMTPVDFASWYGQHTPKKRKRARKAAA